MKNNRKIIRVWPLGTVDACIYEEDRFVVHTVLVGYPFESLENKLKRAHKWADKTMEICKQYEH